MATESPVRLIPGTNGLRTSSGASASPSIDAHELNMLLKERSRLDSMMNGGGGDLFMHRSESAPPSVEGSLAAVSGLLDGSSGFGSRFPKGFAEGSSEGYESEEQKRSDPAYLAYYYQHINLNPRLPPPIISWENLRVAQRLAGAHKSNWKLRSFDDNNSRSLFASQPLLPEEPEEERTIESPIAHGFGSRGRSVVDLIQQDFPRTPSPVYGYNLDGGKEDSSTSMSSVEMQHLMHSQDPSTSPSEPTTGRHSPYPTSRSTSTEPSAASAGTIGFGEALKRTGSSNAMDLSAALQGLNVQESSNYDNVQHAQRDDQSAANQARYRQQRRPAQRPPVQQPYNEYSAESGQSTNSSIFANAAAAAAMSYIAAGNPYYQNLLSMYGPQYGLGGYPTNVSPLVGGYSPPPGVLFDNAAAAARLGRSPPGGFPLYKYADGGLPSTSLQDALYIQYLQRAAADEAARNYLLGSQSEASELGYIGDHKLHRSSSLQSNPYYGRSPYYTGLSTAASSSLLHRDALASLRSGSGSGSGSTYGWPRGGSDIGDDIRGSVLLEEFKSSKSRRFELADIAGHVVEFSADQHGSRFIQQKLENATEEEKAMVFEEVLPQAFTLMTDVFGNYVIQKFFEHGNSQQRRELASLLVGHMLELSLQMYGCRVIQKALEVCDVDQQTQLVVELDGHVMRCVRDQNGNHVIQKCIECVPPDRIQFIISAFYGQVLVLSTHPYGCRVIQRVLEHCTDDQKQAGIMEEILGATCSLAMDQYGNYVIQHVLEHGKPHERSEIITKLAGQIVQMSQHKFASNVVEKCLEFGGPAERQILVDEMLGTTDENAPLQAMMKDQFANYVVQKVLETCSDQQREMLLGRIKVHLHALKKYTYGKHIVARVEKLVAAGERRGAAVHNMKNE